MCAVSSISHPVTRISLTDVTDSLLLIFVAVQFGCPIARTRGVISALIETSSVWLAVFTITRWTSVSATFVNSQLQVSACSCMALNNTPNDPHGRALFLRACNRSAIFAGLPVGGLV